MRRYIDADSLYERLEKRYQEIVENYAEFDAQQYIMGFGEAINALKNEPAADVQEVKHAKNLQNRFKWTFECSLCHWCNEDTYCNDASEFKFCPNCGAKMDSEDDK